MEKYTGYTTATLDVKGLDEITIEIESFMERNFFGAGTFGVRNVKIISKVPSESEKIKELKAEIERLKAK